MNQSSLSSSCLGSKCDKVGGGATPEKNYKRKRKAENSRFTVTSLSLEDTTTSKEITILCGPSDRVTAPAGLGRRDKVFQGEVAEASP